MYREIALTIIIPLCIVALGLAGLSFIEKLKHLRKRRMMERGISDLGSRLRQ